MSATAEYATPVTVLGAGSWGTALAIQFARSGKATRLWGRDRARLLGMSGSRHNERYLPEGEFPRSLAIELDLRAALAGARDVLVVVPSHAFRAVLTEIAPLLGPDMRLAWATKGLELETGMLPHQIAREVLGSQRMVAV